MINNEKVLLIGGNGYIGSNLEKLLNKDYITCTVDNRPNNNTLVADIINFSDIFPIIKDLNPDYIIHLAACTSRDISLQTLEKEIHINYLGTLNVLKSCIGLAKLKSIIIMGTAEEYGDNEGIPFFEHFKEDPITPYSLTKTCAYYMCRLFYNAYQVPFIYLRPTIVYGPGQAQGMFVPSLINALTNDKEFAMTQGEQTRDFIYIDDLVEAIVLAMKERQCIGKILNISNKEVKIIEIARYIEKTLGKNGLLKIGAIEYRPNEIMRYCVDGSQAQKLLNWKPKVSIEEGIKRIVNSGGYKK